MERGRLTSLDTARTFLFGGNATFTLVSSMTSRRFTFKVSRVQDKPFFFVGLLSGSDNQTDYSYMGILNPDFSFRLTRGSRINNESDSYKAFKWMTQVFAAKNEDLFHQVQFWHEGRCCRCGRKLTVPESIAMGIGPRCARRE